MNPSLKNIDYSKDCVQNIPLCWDLNIFAFWGKEKNKSCIFC